MHNFVLNLIRMTIIRRSLQAPTMIMWLLLIYIILILLIFLNKYLIRLPVFILVCLFHRNFNEIIYHHWRCYKLLLLLIYYYTILIMIRRIRIRFNIILFFQAFWKYKVFIYIFERKFCYLKTIMMFIWSFAMIYGILWSFLMYFLYWNYQREGNLKVFRVSSLMK